MLSIPLIQRHFEHARYEHLFDAVAANGMVLPMPLRVRLSQLPAAGVALGLRRLVELTYGPTELSQAMIDWLLARQAHDGGFDGDVLATAAAAASLGRICRDHFTVAVPQIEDAHARAVSYIAARQDDDALMGPADEHDSQQRAMATLFVLYILGEDELFRATSRYAQAMDHFEQDAHRLRGSVADLWELVCITTCGNPTPARAASRVRHAPAMLAAIAA